MSPPPHPVLAGQHKISKNSILRTCCPMIATIATVINYNLVIVMENDIKARKNLNATDGRKHSCIFSIVKTLNSQIVHLVQQRMSILVSLPFVAEVLHASHNAKRNDD